MHAFWHSLAYKNKLAKKNIVNKIMEYGDTSHNRTVYAAPAVAGLASIRLGRLRLLPAPHCGTFGRAVFASQSPYPDWQNSVNIRQPQSCLFSSTLFLLCFIVLSRISQVFFSMFNSNVTSGSFISGLAVLLVWQYFNSFKRLVVPQNDYRALQFFPHNAPPLRLRTVLVLLRNLEQPVFKPHHAVVRYRP